MSCWRILKIEPTKNIEKIKEAYIELSTSLNKNTKEIEKLNLAYNKALSLATASISDLKLSLPGSSNFDILSAVINSSLDIKFIDTVEKFINKVNEIYNNPLLRFNKESWINLLALPILNDDLLNSKIQIQLLEYLYKHKYLSNKIYKLLDIKFNWTKREKELKSTISEEIINSIINSIKNPLPLTYNYLTNIDSEKLDEYLDLREKGYFALQNPELNYGKNYLFDAYSIYTKDLDLLKLIGTYYLNKNDNLMALNYFREAININNNDMYSLSKFGHLLSKTNQYTKAISYLEKYLKKLKNNIDIDCMIDLAHCYHHSYNLQKAKDLYTLLLKLRPWDLSIRVSLENITGKLSNDSISLPLTIPIYKKYLDPYLLPFTSKLKEIYSDFSLRINENSWKELFLLPIASNETLFYLFEQYIIEFITNNKNIPKNIFIFLNTHFNWTSRHDELLSIYPHLKIDTLFNKLYLNDALSYDYINDMEPKNFDKYIEARTLAYNLVKINSKDAEEYLDNALKLYNKDFELYKLFGQYYSNNNLYEKAIENYKIVLSFKEDDYYSICSLALLLTKIKNYQDALYYLNKTVNTPVGNMLLDNEDFLTKYAISFYYTNNLTNAKKYFKKLSKLNPNLSFPTFYLKNINDRLCGKKRKIIPVSIIENPNYCSYTLKNKAKNKLSNLVTIFKHSFAN